VVSARHDQGFWIWFPFMQGVLDTTLSGAVCQCLDSRPRMVVFLRMLLVLQQTTVQINNWNIIILHCLNRR
jgi:hypothetical protein